MWLHIITVYLILSVIITEVALYDTIGTQDNFLIRGGYYLGGILFGPFAALAGIITGIIMSIKELWDSGGK